MKINCSSSLFLKRAHLYHYTEAHINIFNLKQATTMNNRNQLNNDFTFRKLYFQFF